MSQRVNTVEVKVCETMCWGEQWVRDTADARLCGSFWYNYQK